MSTWRPLQARCHALALSCAVLAFGAAGACAGPSPTASPRRSNAPGQATEPTLPSGSPSAPPAVSPTPTLPARRPSPAATDAAVGGQSIGTPPPGVARATAGAVGGQYDLLAVRVGLHEGFTRVVWELAQAEGTPHVVAEVDEVDGHWQVIVELADVYAMEAPQALEPEEGPAGGIVTSVRSLPVRDDALLAFVVGLRGPARIALTTLEAPARVVVDVYPIER